MEWWLVVAMAAVAAAKAPANSLAPQACITASRKLVESHMDIFIIVVPIACSALVLVVTIIVVFCVLKSEMKKLCQVEEAAFKVMDAVLRALLPDKLAEHLGCGIENLAPDPDKPGPGGDPSDKAP